MAPSQGVLTPLQSLRYLQGYCLGDGWVHNRLFRFRLFVYDCSFAERVREMSRQVMDEFGLLSSESESDDRLTGTHEWRFEVGGLLAVKNLDMSLARLSDGPYFIAGLWDADGGWYRPNDSHPLGQAWFFGNWHKVYTMKHALRRSWAISTGGMRIATHAGHRSMIGGHSIVTRRNVYATSVLARSMKSWVDLIGSKMILKRRALV